MDHKVRSEISTNNKDNLKFDCGSNTYCPVCQDPLSPGPCTGVIGGAQPSQQCDGEQGCIPYKFGASSALMAELRAKDTAQGTTCGSGNTLGLYDSYGSCIPGSQGKNKIKAMQTKSLVINANYFNSSSTPQSTKPSDWTSYPIQSLHKAWGDISDNPKMPYNRGVNGRNVYVSGTQETVKFKINGKTRTQNQRVLTMEAHGDLYTGTVPGVGLPAISDDRKSVNAPPVCPGWTDLTPAQFPEDGSNGLPYNRRVGGVACTKDQYGPGVYNILCKVPKTTDTNKGVDGRGYVFAIWQFHYEEIYHGVKGSYNTNDNSQARGDLSADSSDTKFPCFNSCDARAPKSSVCQPAPGNPCAGGTDSFSIVNHEIDIEIPSNSNQINGKSVDWNSGMTWDTMNCNTWVQDRNNYDLKTGAYYTQVGVKGSQSSKSDTKSVILAVSSIVVIGAGIVVALSKIQNVVHKNIIFSALMSAAAVLIGVNQLMPSTKTDSFISDDGNYHWYTIDWHVDNDNYQNNYVAFYFDDPFDPTNADTLLPNKPSGSPLHATRRFVPTRAGRFNFGPWFGWWGFNGRGSPPGAPNFDTIKAKMAHLSIIPQPSAGFDFPQNYDQVGTVCDFHSLYSTPAPTPGPGPTPAPGPPAPTPTPTPSAPASTSYLWLVILLIVVGVLLIGSGIWYAYHKKKGGKGSSRKK